MLRRTLVAVACALALWQPGTARADITYIYDALGRLIAVIDPSGDTAVYRYDPVGNLLSISRQASTTVSIIDFSPASGTAGTAVTIYGTGFSTTPSQNSVMFNGTSAVVTASTPTQITTSVPAGATTGPIAVTAPAGSASSANPFTVLSASDAPTIATFTPTIGLIGTSITVTGTNFVTSPTSNNRLRFNRSAARPDTVTSTSIGTTVPYGATSGRLSIATPGGSAVSTDDFFLPPPGIAVATVAYTGRVTLGGPGVTATLPPNAVGLMVFDGTAGQQITLGYSNISSTLTQFGISVYRPDGVLLSSQGLGFFGGDTHIAALPMTGTYQIVIDGRGSYFGVPFYGNITVTLSQDLVVGPLVANGSAATANITRPGQRARTTFNGTAGQRLSLHSTSSTGMQLALTVTKPDGSTFFSGSLTSTDGTVNWDPLPVSGTYTIVLDPEYAKTLSFDLLLSEALTGTMTVGGSSLSMTIGRAGQRARISFDGIAGQRISVGIPSSTLSSGSVSVLKPDGSTFAGPAGIMAAPGGIDMAPLPTTGTYVIQIDPGSNYTGALTFLLSEELSGSITPGGSAVTVSITRPVQRARLTFTGNANQRVSLKVTASASLSTSLISILKPDGSTQASMGVFGNSTQLLEPTTLGSTGSYAVLVDPNSTYTGDVTLTLYDVPADPNGSITINGPAVNLNLSVPGQNGSLSFAGTSGQAITIRGTNSTIGCLSLVLYESSGWVISSSPCTSSFTMNRTLTGTGTQVIKVDPSGVNSGTVDISVTNP